MKAKKKKAAKTNNKMNSRRWWREMVHAMLAMLVEKKFLVYLRIDVSVYERERRVVIGVVPRNGAPREVMAKIVGTCGTYSDAMRLLLEAAAKGERIHFFAGYRKGGR